MSVDEEVARTRAAFDDHLDAVVTGDVARNVAGYHAGARLYGPRGELVEGRDAIGAWFGARAKFFGSLTLRPERIEIRPGSVTIDWWGTSGQDRLEGCDEFDVDAQGLIKEHRVPHVIRTSREHTGLRLEIEPPVARLVLDRDDKRNAVSQSMLGVMNAFVAEVRADAGVRALVISGSGRAFCAGEDVRGFDFPDPESGARFLAGPLGFFGALETLLKPVIVAVHGAALGFGSEILLVSDAVYADPGSTFGFAEIDHAAVPSVLVTRGLDVVFRRWALDAALTGRRFGAVEARQMGLVHVVTAEPHAAAETGARQMAEWSPAAVAVIKGVLGRDAIDDHDRAREFMPAVLMRAEVAL